MANKKCLNCQEVKTEDRFAKRRNGKLRGACRDCNNAKIRRRYLEKMGGKTKTERRSEFRESDPKVCVKCQKSKPLDDFNVHNADKGQHRNFCKDCQNAWARRYNKTAQAKSVRGRWEEDNVRKIQEYKELYKKLDKNDPVRAAKKKAYHRAYWLQKYGLTIEQYDEMLENQGGGCMICGTMKPGKNRRNFAVDHCHKTGKIRGLLCLSCNVSIGHLQDNVKIFHKAIDYLESFNH